MSVCVTQAALLIRLKLPFASSDRNLKGGHAYLNKAKNTFAPVSPEWEYVRMLIRMLMVMVAVIRNMQLYARFTTTDREVDIAAHVLNNNHDERSHKPRLSMLPMPRR
jgi:hypothetical protein